MNQLAPEEVERIWAPRLGFFNALGDRTTEVDKNTKGVVVMEGKPLKYAPYLAYESKQYFLKEITNEYLISNLFYVIFLALQFAGHENSVYFEREYYHDFTCKFDLLYFPFDTQVTIQSSFFAFLQNLFNEK